MPGLGDANPAAPPGDAAAPDAPPPESTPPTPPAAEPQPAPNAAIAATKPEGQAWQNNFNQGLQFIQLVKSTVAYNIYKAFAHDIYSQRLRRYMNWTALPQIVINVVCATLGTLSLASLTNDLFLGTMITQIVLGVIAAVLAGLQKFFQFAEKAAIHEAIKQAHFKAARAQVMLMDDVTTIRTDGTGQKKWIWSDGKPFDGDEVDKRLQELQRIQQVLESTPREPVPESVANELQPYMEKIQQHGYDERLILRKFPTVLGLESYFLDVPDMLGCLAIVNDGQVSFQMCLEWSTRTHMPKEGCALLCCGNPVWSDRPLNRDRPLKKTGQATAEGTEQQRWVSFAAPAPLEFDVEAGGAGAGYHPPGSSMRQVQEDSNRRMARLQQGINALLGQAPKAPHAWPEVWTAPPAALLPAWAVQHSHIGHSHAHAHAQQGPWSWTHTLQRPVVTPPPQLSSSDLGAPSLAYLSKSLLPGSGYMGSNRGGVSLGLGLSSGPRPVGEADEGDGQDPVNGAASPAAAAADGAASPQPDTTPQPQTAEAGGSAAQPVPLNVLAATCKAFKKVQEETFCRYLYTAILHDLYSQRLKQSVNAIVIPLILLNSFSAVLASGSLASLDSLPGSFHQGMSLTTTVINVIAAILVAVQKFYLFAEKATLHDSIKHAYFQAAFDIHSLIVGITTERCHDEHDKHQCWEVMYNTRGVPISSDDIKQKLKRLKDIQKKLDNVPNEPVPERITRQLRPYVKMLQSQDMMERLKQNPHLLQFPPILGIRSFFLEVPERTGLFTLVSDGRVRWQCGNCFKPVQHDLAKAGWELLCCGSRCMESVGKPLDDKDTTKKRDGARAKQSCWPWGQKEAEEGDTKEEEVKEEKVKEEEAKQQQADKQQAKSADQQQSQGEADAVRTKAAGRQGNVKGQTMNGTQPKPPGVRAEPEKPREGAAEQQARRAAAPSAEAVQLTGRGNVGVTAAQAAGGVEDLPDVEEHLKSIRNKVPAVAPGAPTGAVIWAQTRGPSHVQPTLPGHAVAAVAGTSTSRHGGQHAAADTAVAATGVSNQPMDKPAEPAGSASSMTQHPTPAALVGSLASAHEDSLSTNRRVIDAHLTHRQVPTRQASTPVGAVAALRTQEPQPWHRSAKSESQMHSAVASGAEMLELPTVPTAVHAPSAQPEAKERPRDSAYSAAAGGDGLKQARRGHVLVAMVAEAELAAPGRQRMARNSQEWLGDLDGFKPASERFADMKWRIE